MWNFGSKHAATKRNYRENICNLIRQGTGDYELRIFEGDLRQKLWAE